MALKLDEIRALAERVAASHGLDVVDVEYQGGGGKHRTLRVFIEKNAAERARLRERVARLQEERENAAAGEGSPGSEGEQGEDEAELESGPDDDADAGIDQDESLYTEQEADEAFLAGLPSVTNLEQLSGITHGDCELFSRDFGTVLDIEELAPGTEYLLEVSSPGLDRRLTQAADYRRFAGSLVKVHTFEAVGGSRHWQGRVAEMRGETVVLEVGGKPERKKAKKGAAPPPDRVEIALANVEKAHLVPEF
jgi:ribosome maturation factor RimP